MKKTFTVEVEYKESDHVGKDIVDELTIMSAIEKTLDKYVEINYLKEYAPVEVFEDE